MYQGQGMNNLKKIGILGGTFDPIHNGHIEMAKCAVCQLNLDKVILMPTGNPPHKNINSITDAKIRLSMIKIAIENISYLECSDFEMKRNGIIYTADTLELFIKNNENMQIYFIMGADSLLSIENWHTPEKIFRLCNVVVCDRNDNNENILNHIKFLKNKYNASIFYLNMPLINISSTNIKRCIKNGDSVEGMLPKNVINFIKENNLYR